MRGRVLVVPLLVAAWGAAARAQMIGAPVLQNAFSNPGWTVGADFGSGEHLHSYGGALAWAPTSGKWQLSGGAAWAQPSSGSSGMTWGARAMAPLWGANRALGIAAFGGLGGLSVSGTSAWRFPLGLSLGYRRAIGADRGISAYASPFYSLTRLRANGQTNDHGLFRVSFGIDAALLPGVGVTVGYETGSSAGANQAGPSGGIFGAAISYALRHR